MTNDEKFALSFDSMLTWKEISKENEPWFDKKAIFYLPQPHQFTKDGIEMNAVGFLKIDGKVICQYVHWDSKTNKLFLMLDKNMQEYFKNMVEN